MMCCFCKQLIMFDLSFFGHDSLLMLYNYFRILCWGFTRMKFMGSSFSCLGCFFGSYFTLWFAQQVVALPKVIRLSFLQRWDLVIIVIVQVLMYWMPQLSSMECSEGETYQEFTLERNRLECVVSIRSLSSFTQSFFESKSSVHVKGFNLGSTMQVELFLWYPVHRMQRAYQLLNTSLGNSEHCCRNNNLTPMIPFGLNCVIGNCSSFVDLVQPPL